MPFISTKTNKPISDAAAKTLKEAYASAIELLPGKTEKWLMLSFEGDTKMAFHGDMDTPMAFLTVSLVGKAPTEAYDALTVRLCAVMGEVLGIAADMVYVKYEEVDHWGWNNINF
ncbi:MAG: hypothetical protein E7657_01370 [Ruminococcaceae bacterium]|nr:hypothetical protein [Oscillospiraceae bacterium]